MRCISDAEIMEKRSELTGSTNTEDEERRYPEVLSFLHTDFSCIPEENIVKFRNKNKERGDVVWMRDSGLFH